jgi:hypothetical protein
LRFDYSRAKAGDATEWPSNLSQAIRKRVLQDHYLMLSVVLVGQL